MTDTAVVAAAGRGARLGRMTDARPKCLVPVGGRPAIAWVLDAIEVAGLDRVVITTGWLADHVEAVVPRITSLRVEFVRQEPLDGTAGALLAARSAVGDRPFLYSWADLLFPTDALARLLAVDGPASLAINRVDDPTAGAAVTVVDGFITDLVEKPPPGTAETPYNASGMGVLPSEVWELLETVPVSPRGEREMTDAEIALVRGGTPIRAVEVTPVFDIGTPTRLSAAEEWLGS